jgi:prepilin-type N-terminal cleavage/methylation domain-containing protein
MLKEPNGFKNHALQSGLTLVEVVVAMAILGFSILAIATVQRTAINVNSRAFDLAEASNIAQSVLEDLLAKDYNHDDLNEDENPHNLAEGVAPPGYDEMPQGYRVEWCVNEDIAGTNSLDHAKMVVLRVSYTGPGDDQYVKFTGVKPWL